MIVLAGFADGRKIRPGVPVVGNANRRSGVPAARTGLNFLIFLLGREPGSVASFCAAHKQGVVPGERAQSLAGS